MPNKLQCLLYALKVLGICIIFSWMLFALSVCFGCAVSVPESRHVASMHSVTYVLDAVHGGRDGGAVSMDGTTEKELNLSITLCMRDYLQLCGAETVMTRTHDTLVCDESDPNLKGKLKATDLQNRLKLAQAAAPSVLVSLHMNKFAIAKYKGLQVYYSKNHSDSQGLASLIQERVRSILQPENDRKIKMAGSNIFLLDRICEPAVLIECGFLSNSAETEKLKDPLYQATLATVIADSLLAN